ncbi:MAG: branched-chain-amino-acid transaminase [Verrucomicrobiota bacterium]
MPKVYIDGQLLDEADAKISVFDHGLLYGDGIFEGIRIYDGRVFELEAHLDRFADSAKAIDLTLPLDNAAIAEAILETIRANELQDGYVRLLATRGAGGLGLNPYLCEKASLIVIASKISLYPEDKYTNGLTVVTCGTRRPSHAALSPTVKSLNYLNNVMAKIEAMHAGADEGVMLNEQGLISECTGDNIFVVKNGAVTTPPVAAGILDGITRRIVMNIIDEIGLPLSEPMMSRYDLYTADEVFLTGTAAEIIAVVQYDNRTIGDGKPGPVTRQCIEKYRDLTKTTGTPIYNAVPSA